MEREEREALLGLLAHVDQSDPGLDGFVYLDIQKIFYYLRERLNDDNDIADLLPYYWYIDGTVSDTVQESVNHGMQAEVLQTKPTERTGSGQWYEFDDGFVPESTEAFEDDYETAKEEILLVVEEDYDIYSDYETKLEDIYADAPYDFQRFFKFEVLFELDYFAEGLPWTYDPEDLSERISAAEAYLPLDSAFDEFNRIFSRYVNTATRYLSLVDSENRALADRFKHLSQQIWKLFCQQLRLLEHDPEYDSKLDEWEDQYEQTRRLVVDDLVEFRRLVSSEFDTDLEVERAPSDSAWASIAADYLDEQAQ